MRRRVLTAMASMTIAVMGITALATPRAFATAGFDQNFQGNSADWPSPNGQDQWICQGDTSLSFVANGQATIITYRAAPGGADLKDPINCRIGDFTNVQVDALFSFEESNSTQSELTQGILLRTADATYEDRSYWFEEVVCRSDAVRIQDQLIVDTVKKGNPTLTVLNRGCLPTDVFHLLTSIVEIVSPTPCPSPIGTGPDCAKVVTQVRANGGTWFTMTNYWRYDPSVVDMTHGPIAFQGTSAPCKPNDPSCSPSTPYHHDLDRVAATPLP